MDTLRSQWLIKKIVGIAITCRGTITEAKMDIFGWMEAQSISDAPIFNFLKIRL